MIQKSITRFCVCEAIFPSVSAFKLVLDTTVARCHLAAPLAVFSSRSYGGKVRGGGSGRQ